MPGQSTYLAFLKPLSTPSQSLPMAELADVFRQVGVSQLKQVIASGTIEFSCSLPVQETETILNQSLLSLYGDKYRLVVYQRDEVYERIANYNIFMMCEAPCADAFRELPEGYSFRLCRPDELGLWKQTAVEPVYSDALSEYFMDVYAGYPDEFFSRCTFVVDQYDRAVATCFIWKAYRLIDTIAFLRVLPSHENLGIGRALLGKVIQSASLPVYLHTHPTSYRAIKLYADFGFCFIDDPVLGTRTNNLYESLDFLKKVMPQSAIEGIAIKSAPEPFLEAVGSSPKSEF
ncbi:MAG: GNAT family N-acetyltransferase [Coriobacteriia bacterium]|nr:GNAT family N-acetyltransferase [Coriobacteriia bacterium]